MQADRRSETEPIDKAEPRSSAELLWQGDGIVIELPTQPAIPLEEGTDIVIRTDRASFEWQGAEVGELAKVGFYAVALGTILAERGHTDDAHANLQLDRMGVHVYGRKPLSEATQAWASSVLVREDGVNAPENQALAERERSYFERFMNSWRRYSTEASLFPGGIEGYSADSIPFKTEAEKWADRPWPWQETLLWMDRRHQGESKFALVAVNDPHLDGIHLVLHARPEYWNQRGGHRNFWHQGIEQGNGVLEGLVISRTVERILAAHADKLGFCNPEIRCSGNFATDFLSPEQGGLMDTKALAAARRRGRFPFKQELHRFHDARKAEAGSTGSGTHFHVYGTRSPDQFVELAYRPRDERPDLWEGILRLDPAEGRVLLGLMQQELTKQLAVQLTGPSRAS